MSAIQGNVNYFRLKKIDFVSVDVTSSLLAIDFFRVLFLFLVTVTFSYNTINKMCALKNVS